jgi:hypothetical protein
MNANEEELQSQLEAGKTLSNDNLDVRAYQQVFSALKKSPGYTLSSSFSDSVIQKILERENKIEYRRDLWWLVMGVFLLVIAFVASMALAIAYVGFKPGFGFLSGIADYKGLLIIAGLLIIVFNRMDKQLLKVNQTT